MSDKTHYRKAFNSPYLSSADIVEPTVLTIEYVVLEKDHSKKSQDFFNTAYFTDAELRPGERLKPMILNAHNSKIMRTLGGSHFIDDWKNVPVTVYVDPNVRFGRDTVEGLRISPEPPRVQKPAFDAGNEKQMERAVAAYMRDGNCKSIEKHMTLTENDKNEIDANAQAKRDADEAAA